jgi:hypothetical protein
MLGVLPSVEEVEGLFFGVPAPIADDWFFRFLDDFEDSGGVEGITAAEWAAWVGQPVDLVRERLDVLVDGETLTYDPNTERYAFRRIESPIDPQPPPGETANPMPASKSEPSPNSQEEQAKSSPVQSSNEVGGDTGGPGGASVPHGQSREEPDLMAPSLEPRSPLPESDATAAEAQLSDPSATKLPPPPRGS